MMTTKIQPNSLTRRLSWAVFAVLWVAGTGTGMLLLAGYSNSPGDQTPVPMDWPSESRLRLSDDRATLVMFAHPRCPCTRASLAELEKIVARHKDSVTPWVVFLKPAGEVAADDNWERTDLWRTASAIPGVHVISDGGGAEARRFHAGTSGQTLLYGEQGELLFSGGITFARGHSGDNAGRAAIESYLSGQVPGYRHTPVFGCPLAAADQENRGAD